MATSPIERVGLLVAQAAVVACISCSLPVIEAQSGWSQILSPGIVAASHAPESITASVPVFPLPSYLATTTQTENPAVQWNLAIQWVMMNSNETTMAPEMFAFTHLAMWQALQANNESSSPADQTAVIALAALLTMKDLNPLESNRYDTLFEQQTEGLSTADLDAAQKIAEPVVENLLVSRPLVNSQLRPANAPSPGSPGEFQDLGADDGTPDDLYATAKPLLLPADLSAVGFVANCTPPPAVPSSAYSIAYTSTKLYGSLDSSLRSADQTNTASFWNDAGPGTSGILGQWNRLLLNTIPGRLPLAATVELLARFNVGMYDTTVAIFHLKNTFDFWRPITAIRNGDPSHPAESDWTPLITNPNSPSYPSDQAAYAGLAEVTLNNFYGRDAMIFKVSTENRGPDGVLLPSRVYQSFTQVGSEVTQSRYFGGMEFPMDSTQGRELGGKVAGYIADNFDELSVAPGPYPGI